MAEEKGKRLAEVIERGLGRIIPSLEGAMVGPNERNIVLNISDPLDRKLTIESINTVSHAQGFEDIAKEAEGRAGKVVVISGRQKESEPLSPQQVKALLIPAFHAIRDAQKTETEHYGALDEAAGNLAKAMGVHRYSYSSTNNTAEFYGAPGDNGKTLLNAALILPTEPHAHIDVDIEAVTLKVSAEQGHFSALLGTLKRAVEHGEDLKEALAQRPPTKISPAEQTMTQVNHPKIDIRIK